MVFLFSKLHSMVFLFSEVQYILWFFCFLRYIVWFFLFTVAHLWFSEVYFMVFLHILWFIQGAFLGFPVNECPFYDFPVFLYKFYVLFFVIGGTFYGFLFCRTLFICSFIFDLNFCDDV